MILHILHLKLEVSHWTLNVCAIFKVLCQEWGLFNNRGAVIMEFVGDEVAERTGNVLAFEMKI